jgi:alpha-beta hydrolase superfamily lysophospholipase
MSTPEKKPLFEELSLQMPDGYGAYARFFAPAGEPRGAVLYLHGIQSHCGWYECSAAALCDAGFAVLQPDRRGSGRNVAGRGHADSHEQLVADASCAADVLRDRTGCHRYHVVGVSWGGKLAVAAHVADDSRAASLSLVTPGLFPRIGVSGSEKFRIGLAMLSDPHKLFDIPLNDADLFTTHPEWNRFISEDPLTLRQASAGFYLASRRMDRVCARLNTTRPVPLHLLLAGEERIIDNERTVDFVRQLHWQQTQISTYEAARHSLEFEPPDDGYFRDLVTWIGTVQDG